MHTPWIGSRKIAVVPASTTGDPVPANYFDRVVQRMLYDPIAGGIDGSVRKYLHTISYGKALLEADVFAPVTIPDSDMGKAINMITGIQNYQYACVVLPTGGRDRTGWAWWDGPPFNFTPSRPGPNNLVNACRVNMQEGLGVWAMEIMHMTTAFGDLYGTNPNPGEFDNMACSCGTHPSAYTKLKLGWLDSRGVVTLSQNSVGYTLHALELLQPPPPGRVTAIRIPSKLSQNYFLVEARLRIDPHDAPSVISSGIGSEGVVVYEVSEPAWPLQLRTPTALRPGETYVNDAERLHIAVGSAVDGGLSVHVECVASPECPTVLAQIKQLSLRIGEVEDELQEASPDERRRLLQVLAQLKSQLRAAEQRSRALCCG
jgi:hypothetical protein